MAENLMCQNLAKTVMFDLVDQSILLLKYQDTAIYTAHLMHSYGPWKSKSVFKIECRCKKPLVNVSWQKNFAEFMSKSSSYIDFDSTVCYWFQVAK